jgi:hypothetical protein
MFLRSALLSLSALVAAKEMPKDEIKAAKLYDSGIRHANNLALKQVGLPETNHDFMLMSNAGELGYTRSSGCI